MRKLPIFSAVLLALVGCNQQSPVPVLAPPIAALPKSEGDKVAAAKSHVQQFVDRLLGGDLSVKQGLLGLSSLDFDSIDSIQIKSALPKYQADGKKVDGMIVVVMHVTGFDAQRRRAIQKNIDLDLMLKDGKWKIFGSNL
jgi:hypothetical protein